MLLILAAIAVPRTAMGNVSLVDKRMSDRGLYVTSYVARSPSLFDSIRKRAKEAGFNTLVIDAKVILNRPLLKILKRGELTPETKVEPSPWLVKLTKELNEEGFIVTTRLVVFRDSQLAEARPDLAVRESEGDFYMDLMGEKWVDPYSDEVRLYNELIAERAALSGVDEIQFDYIRFPVEASAADAYYPFQQEDAVRTEAINAFLEAVHKRVKKYNVSIAADTFGITAWQREADVEILGQDLKGMAKYLDVISLMFYPSHFGAGFGGFSNPGLHPYYFVNTGIKRARKILSGEDVTIVPWLQGFNLRSPTFGPDYILEQIRAVEDEGIGSYLVWNPRNDYRTAFQALKKAGEAVPHSYPLCTSARGGAPFIDTLEDNLLDYKVQLTWTTEQGCYEKYGEYREVPAAISWSDLLFHSCRDDIFMTSLSPGDLQTADPWTGPLP